MKTKPNLPLEVRVPPAMKETEILFVRDLPSLLKTKLGRWVVYTPAGCIAEGEDELVLFEQCERDGLERGSYLIARVEPDPPAAEVSETWFPYLPTQSNCDAVAFPRVFA